jgi:hypothetical protein
VCVKWERDVVLRIEFFSPSFQRAVLPSSSLSRRRRAIEVGRAGSSKPTPPRVPARGRGLIRFLRSVVATACYSSAFSMPTSWFSSDAFLLLCCSSADKLSVIMSILSLLCILIIFQSLALDYELLVSYLTLLFMLLLSESICSSLNCFCFGIIEDLA